MMSNVRNDAEILARASKQPELFGIVFDRHFAAIHRYLQRRVGGDAADELSGEVFRIAFEQRSRFRDLHESALPWLYGIATNLLLKRWRAEARHLRALASLEGEHGGDQRADSGAVDDRLTAQALRRRLLAALMCLPQHDRDVVILIAWEELSYAEVAATLDIAEGTVRSRLHRARRTLRDLLPELRDETSDGELRAIGSDVR
jgi:RNA polymerase sigma factor (sigma-70 family)